jgi:hypothetical protein
VPCAARGLGTWPSCAVDCHTEDPTAILIHFVTSESCMWRPVSVGISYCHVLSTTNVRCKVLLLHQFVAYPLSGDFNDMRNLFRGLAAWCMFVESCSSAVLGSAGGHRYYRKFSSHVKTTRPKDDMQQLPY